MRHRPWYPQTAHVSRTSRMLSAAIAVSRNVDNILRRLDPSENSIERYGLVAEQATCRDPLSCMSVHRSATPVAEGSGLPDFDHVGCTTEHTISVSCM